MANNFVPSPYQQAVFDFVSHGKGSALVTAVAGAGKTTTIVEALKLIPAGRTTSFLAFNKRIADELKAKVPAGVRAQTFHSVGFGAWGYMKNRNVQVSMTNKSRDLMDAHFGDDDVRMYGSFACKLVSLAKQIGMGFLSSDTPDVWAGLIDHYDVSLDSTDASESEGVEIARRLLAHSVRVADAREGGPSVIDADDMLYMPLLRNARFFPHDWVFVDEAQDTNGIQLAMLRRMLKPSGRLVAVGDRRQAIYGFRGADASAMDNIAKAFNCVELPLTISYRCSQAVVRQAQTIVPYIEAHPEAPEGRVWNWYDQVSPNDNFGKTTIEYPEPTFSAGEAIICRNTAPLVSKAYELIGQGIGCKVLGREIGTGLIKLIEKMHAFDMDLLGAKLEAWSAREQAKFMAKGQETKAEAAADKVAAINAVIERLEEEDRTIAALIKALDAMFSDDSDAKLVMLMTAHKSKGLEFERVYVLSPELMPSRWARQAWQQEQEANLQYVTWTRAKRELIFLQ